MNRRRFLAGASGALALAASGLATPEEVRAWMNRRIYALGAPRIIVPVVSYVHLYSASSRDPIAVIPIFDGWGMADVDHSGYVSRADVIMSDGRVVDLPMRETFGANSLAMSAGDTVRLDGMRVGYE